MAGVRKTPRNGIYQGWYCDATGNRKYFTGTRRKAETQSIAERLEDDHRQVGLGYRPAATTADKHKTRPVAEVIKEYLDWGKAQGGRNGKPWGITHARMRRTYLSWWKKCLGLESLADVRGILPRVEGELRQLQAIGRAGKTIANYAEALGAFCDWAVRRGYLADDPLKAMAPFDTTPLTQRRAMTKDEITRLLDVCPSDRRLLLETALLSGLRANELRNLSIDDLDLDRSGLRLDAAWTKNRKDGFQPLPESLTKRLSAFSSSGEASRLYDKNFRRKDAKRRAPTTPLLYVPTHTARELDKDLEAAGIPKTTAQGKIDFHACRVAYINMVLDSGVSVKEAQALARHATPEMTVNVYGRVREDRLAEAVEKVAENIVSPEKRVRYVSKQAVGAEQKSATSIGNKRLHSGTNGGGGGNRTRVRKRFCEDHYVRSRFFNLIAGSSNRQDLPATSPIGFAAGPRTRPANYPAKIIIGTASAGSNGPNGYLKVI
jgi:integrase